MNISALTFIVFPLLGIIIPFITWISKKEKLRGVNEIGKAIINFQITWTVLLFAVYIFNTLFIKTQINSTGSVEPKLFLSHQRFNLIFFFIIYGYNAVLIIRNTFRIRKNKEIIYSPKINFI